MTLETGKHNRPQSQCALTLLRLVLVMALLVAAAFAVASRLPEFRPNTQEQEPPALREITTAIGEFDVDNGFYPKNLQELLQRPPNAKNWHGPYLDYFPVDPWGDAYLYCYPGKHNPAGYDLWSAGPDGKSGTSDDTGNW